MVTTAWLFLGYFFGVFVAPYAIRGMCWVVDLVVLYRLSAELREYAPSIYEDHLYGYARLVAVMCWPISLAVLLVLAFFALVYHGTASMMLGDELTNEDLPEILPFRRDGVSRHNGSVRPYRPDPDHEKD